MFKDKKLIDFVHIKNSIFTPSECEFIIANTDNYTKHSWFSYHKLEDSPSPDTEFMRSNNINFNGRLLLLPKLYNIVDDYIGQLKNSTWYYSGISTPAINKYDTNTQMLSHVDHIHSLFTGDKKGIPILSIIGLLNDNFSGGEFVFWDDYIVNLKQGDILIFPSIFLYEHRVNPIIEGTRYSFVSWVY